ncbi:MAG TPA: gamma-glutamylcyclotransferase [Pseudonocardiaceae bacterium]|jgi:gamma-glutamylcyclotransferase (GGCT)/AIG2-like uncharacterized protein YtfP|nr:gamma-glutamylcyclotransferase [Pseudonocardiaceae bacterium]
MTRTSLADADFPADPYPGARPAWSFVHVAGMSYPLAPRRSTRWSWELTDGTELNQWLAGHQAPPLDARIPVLAYGSNACPAKISWLRATYGLTGPVVVLRARCSGLAAVWAAGLRRRDGQRPATLAADPDAVETHAVWLATRSQITALDACEGRGERYRLTRLRSGQVTTEDGTAIDGVLAYTGLAETRAPLLVDGRPVRCADVSQARAVSLAGEPGADGLAGETVDGDPHPNEWPDLLFVYGTLQPGASAWPVARPWVNGEPRPGTLAGALYDTGRGYPALRLADGRVPGWLLPLRSPAAALSELDDYENSAYERARVRLTDGTLCWTYVWREPVDGMARLPAGWPAQAAR